MSLIGKTAIKQTLEDTFFGNDQVQMVKSCQIASRFPQEQCDADGKIPENWSQTWHIDNYTEKDFERKTLPKDFSCLVGIYLTDNETEFCGNSSSNSSFFKEKWRTRVL